MGQYLGGLLLFTGSCCHYLCLFISGVSGLYLPWLPELLHGQRREEAGGLRRARESSGADSPHAGHQPHQYHSRGAPKPRHQLPRQHPSQRHHSNRGPRHGHLLVGGGTRQQGLWRFTGDAVWLLRSRPPPVSRYAHSPPRQLIQLGVPGTCGGGARTRQLQWQAIVRVALRQSPETAPCLWSCIQMQWEGGNRRRCSVTVCAEISFQFCFLLDGG